MNSPYKHNLLSTDLANKLSYQIISAHENKNIHYYISHQQMELEYKARLCWRGYSNDPYITGGLELWVDIPAEYSERPVRVSKHICPGWTEKSLKNSIKNFWVKVWKEKHLVWTRNDVYRIAQKTNIDQDEVLEIEERTGNISEYYKMDEGACIFWKSYLEWVHNQQNKEDAITKP